jgi:DNA-directed RNA polymerase subunit RPC12/RpoP
MKVEIIEFECSACGKKSTSIVKKGKLICQHCKYVYIMVNGEWVPEKMKDFYEKRGKYGCGK